MKEDTIFIIFLVGTFGVVFGSIIMAVKGVDGWGWFLFVAVLLFASIKYKNTDNKKIK